MPPQVPSKFAEDYREACLVLDDSPKASAALSRRCLQYILQEKAGVKHENLAKEIQEIINNNAIGNYRRLLIRWERKVEIFRAFLYIACLMITLRQL